MKWIAALGHIDFDHCEITFRLLDDSRMMKSYLLKLAARRAPVGVEIDERESPAHEVVGELDAAQRAAVNRIVLDACGLREQAVDTELAEAVADAAGRSGEFKFAYPDDASEKAVIRLVRGETAPSGRPGGGDSAPIPQSAIFQARDEIAAVRIAEPMEDYIVALVAATRRPAVFSEDLAKYIQVGVSPRGSLALDKVSRAHAWLDGRDQVTPDDIRAVINDCLRHRIVPSFEAQADGVTTDDIVAMVVKLVAVA